MRFKGTKEPWVKRKKEILANDKYVGFACNYLMDEKISDEEAEANAQLISKAPEMLEMLKDLARNAHLNNYFSDKVISLIKEATTI